MVAGSPETRFVNFNHHSVAYKTVNGHDIEAEVLIPKNIKPGSYPLLAQFHGGGLYTGKALYPDWFPPWLVAFILSHSAIIVSPNYRLLPESSGADILTDLSDFWAWLKSSFPAFLASKSDNQLTIDFDHILLHGESAGGYMGLQSALLLPEGTIKAMILPYAMSQPLPGKTGMTEKFGMPIPGPEFLDEYLKSIEPGTVVSYATPPARMEIGFAMIEHGRMAEYLGTDKRFNPYEVLDGAKHFPKTWLLQGADDSIVAANYSVELAAKLEKLFPGSVRLTIEPGEHGFDGEHTPEQSKWMKEGLAWVEEAWM